MGFIEKFTAGRIRKDCMEEVAFGQVRFDSLKNGLRVNHSERSNYICLFQLEIL